MRSADAASAVHVRFRKVSKRYGSAVLAVRDLNLDVFRGEFLTLLGPSGSGKTTALMMLAGFEEASEGEILIDGQRIDKVPANRRGIGMVFQNYALFPHMTVAENLAFPLEVRKVPRPEIAHRVNTVLDMVRLAGVGSRRPDQLSGGQQQRIAVARALIFRPALVLMDEPLGALDKQLREQMQYEIKDIHARLGVTFIYVTHDQTEALTMSDRIAVFNAGSIQQLSDPAALYERPQTDFVASFIGENNRFSGTLGPSEVGVVSVLLNGGALCIRAIMPKAVTAAAGARVTVSVRPERIAVLSDGATMPNEIGATVRSVIFVGDHLRLVSDVPGIGPIVVKLPKGSGLPVLAPGVEVRLGWRTEDCLALDS
jgi:putative spermidine/putrescine transport system ATP-binding protein